MGVQRAEGWWFRVVWSEFRFLWMVWASSVCLSSSSSAHESESSDPRYPTSLQAQREEGVDKLKDPMIRSSGVGARYQVLACGASHPLLKHPSLLS